MLKQISLWAAYVGMGADVVLMVRILALRLRRVYVFITLYALLNLLYDGLALKLGMESKEFGSVEVYWKFVEAVVFPLAAWDIFEEAKATVDSVRKLAMSRMATSLVFISIWGFLIGALAGSEKESGGTYKITALIVWSGSVAATLAFLWVMRRAMQAHNWELPRNTVVWNRFFLVMLAMSAVIGVMILVWPFLGENVAGIADKVENVMDIVLQTTGVVITGWCVFQLRAVAPAAAINEKS